MICRILYIILLSFFYLNTYAQTASEHQLEIGNTSINQSEPLTVTIIVKDEAEKIKVKFPDFAGFTRKSQSSTKKLIDQNGKPVFEHRITQEYFANKIGPQRIPPYSIFINDEALIGAAIYTNISPKTDGDEDNFKDFIDGSAYEFVDVKDDAFFAITSSELSPFVGEGFLLTIAFYVATSNKAELNFVNINGQLEDILKKIRPKTCYEENIAISEVKEDQIVKIGNKKYKQYRIFQSIYYPFTSDPIIIPAVSWYMTKYKIAKDQELSNEKIEGTKSYFSKSIYIRPKKLPKIAEKQTNIGSFILEEKLNKKTINTGQAVKYTYIIKGKGNLAMVDIPTPQSDSLFEFFEPKVTKNFLPGFSRIFSEKRFEFDIIPKKPGFYNLNEYFDLEYFNTETKSIEILKGSQSLVVKGDEILIKNNITDSKSDIYKNINELDSSLSPFNFRIYIFYFSGLIVFCMLILFFYIIWPTGRQ